METQNANEVDGYADVDGFIFPDSLCLNMDSSCRA